MNTYESIIIFNPENKSRIKCSIDIIKNKIQSYSNKLVQLDDTMGEKELAYEVKGHKTGYYVIFRYRAEPDNIPDLESSLRVNSDILKFLTMSLNDPSIIFQDYLNPSASEQPHQIIDVFDLIFNINN